MPRKSMKILWKLPVVITRSSYSYHNWEINFKIEAATGGGTLPFIDDFTIMHHFIASLLTANSACYFLGRVPNRNENILKRKDAIYSVHQPLRTHSLRNATDSCPVMLQFNFSRKLASGIYGLWSVHVWNCGWWRWWWFVSGLLNLWSGIVLLLSVMAIFEEIYHLIGILWFPGIFIVVFMVSIW